MSKLRDPAENMPREALERHLRDLWENSVDYAFGMVLRDYAARHGIHLGMDTFGKKRLGV